MRRNDMSLQRQEEDADLDPGGIELSQICNIALYLFLSLCVSLSLSFFLGARQIPL